MHIFFSAGEPSGDEHGAELIQEWRRLDPAVRISGFGGPEMASAGQDQLFRLTDMAVIGFLAIIPLLRKFFALKADAKRFIAEQRPDAVVLIDFPGFHWHIAKVAKQAGIPVYYYMPPQLWAWAPWRIRKVYRYVDTVFSGLPFEADWYRKHGVDVVRVPHPFFEHVLEHQLDQDTRDEVASHGRSVAILPGSRLGEVAKNFPAQLLVMQEVVKQHDDVHFAIACYRDKQRALCEKIYAEFVSEHGPLPLAMYTDRTPEVLDASVMTLMVSGSVSLEVLARKRPTVVLYRGSVVLWAIGHLLITVKHFSLPNLIAGREIMPEFPFCRRLEKHAASMSYILNRWLSNEPERKAVADQVAAVAAEMTASVGASVAVEGMRERLGVACEAQEVAHSRAA